MSEDLNTTTVQTKKATKRRRHKKEKKPFNKDEKERKSIASITHKKSVASCNWQSFIASNKQSINLPESVIEDVKKNGFQKGLARKNRKAGLDPDHQPTPETKLATTKESPTCGTTTGVSTAKLTKQIAIDCEMVGVDDGKENMLARVSLVNKYGDCVYDKFVFPKEEVVDYRTFVSGVRAEDLESGESFEVVNKEVGEILKGRILVGHALRNDLKVLHLPHPRKNIRDTSRYTPFRQFSDGRLPSLKKLTEAILGYKIQEGEHDSVIDARATMQIYMMYRKEWEETRRRKRNPDKKQTTKPL